MLLRTFARTIRSFPSIGLAISTTLSNPSKSLSSPTSMELPACLISSMRSAAIEEITEFAYKHGAASLLDFLDAERSNRAIQLSYRQALATYLLALEQLREAVGTRSLP